MNGAVVVAILIGAALLGDTATGTARIAPGRAPR